MRRGCRGSVSSGSRAAVVALLGSIFILAGSTLKANGAPATPSSPTMALSQSSQGNTRARIEAAYGQLPLYFIENQGQLDNRVRYYEKRGSRAIFFTRKDIRFAFYPGETKSLLTAGRHRREGHRLSRLRQKRTPITTPEVISLTPVGLNPKAEITASEPTAGKISYLHGPDPKNWRSNLTTYRSVVYREAYPGIDLTFYGTGRQLEYDIILQPGADPRRIKFRFQGIKELALTPEGDLLVKLPDGGSLLQKKPLVYQEINGVKVKREGKFRLAGGKDRGGYSFEVASYDRSAPLVIDPIFFYSTYLGGSYYDVGNAIALDADGNAYITGTTFSPSFPATSSVYRSSFSGAIEAFVAKFSPTGVLVYSTFLGGSQSQAGYGIAVDEQGCAYVTGYTESPDFPTVNPWQAAISGYSDGFVSKLSADGSSLVYSSFLGYTYDDAGYSLARDGNGNVYVAGETINQQSISKILVAKITAAGTLGYKLSLGGTNHDAANGIAGDNAGNAYVTGYTQSKDFPVSSSSIQSYLEGAKNAFLVKIDTNGNRIYGTYLGGSGSDEGNAIAVDSSGNAYLTGTTTSYDFPTQNPLQGALQGASDAFVAKINISGNLLVYSTFLGQTEDDGGYAIALDGSGGAYVTGFNVTPQQNPPPPPSLKDGYVYETAIIPSNAFVAKISDAGPHMDFYWHFGGSDDDWGNGIAIDQAANIYVTGETWSTDFPTQNPYQFSLGGQADGFVTKMKNASCIVPALIELGFFD